MFCENGNAALRVESLYGSMPPYALRSRLSRAPLQEDIRSLLDIACQLMAANGMQVSLYQGFLPNYDNRGRRVRRTESSHDAYGRVTKTTDPAGGDVLYTYDNRDKLLSVTDPETNTTSYQYDRDNQPTRETRPEGGVTRYSYNPAGKIATMTDVKGQQARYTYDDAGRMTTLAWYAAAAATTPEKTVAFSYDEVGNLTGYNDGITSADYAYDANNRKIGETVNYGTFQKSLAYTYTANGLKASFTGPDGTVVRYGYDTNNQLNSVQVPVGTIITNRFDWTVPTKWTFPGGVTQERQYDPLLRPLNIGVKDQAGNALLDSVYTYDDAGNIDTKQSEHGLYGYSYDSLDRLTQADNPTLPNEVYTYDGVGNRMTDNSKPGAWSYNTDNQLTNIDNQTNFTYDANGSLIQKTNNGVTTEYQYNIENRLTGLTRNGSTVASYYYDPFGRRLWKETNGQRTYFLYAEEGLIGEFDNVGTPIRQYGYKPDGIWGTDPIFQKAGGQYYFYQNDHFGTPQKLVKTNGAVVWSAKYQVFGGVQVDAGSSVVNPLRFPGQYYDQETGLHYNGFRTYDPSTGRYLTSDPIGLGGGLNTYAYVLNNPINWVDPLGLEILVCNRKVSGFPFVGNHAYAWDTTTNTAEGMRGSSGSGADSNEKGRAGGDSCNDVEGSKGEEEDIMDFMRDNQNNGMWFPFANDCHNAVQDAVENAGLKYPGAPGGRFGAPQ